MNKAIVPSFLLAMSASLGLAAEMITQDMIPSSASDAPPLPDQSPFSGSLEMGYATHAGFRGLIPAGKDGRNTDHFELKTLYDLNGNDHLAWEMRYKLLWDKTWIDRNETNLSLGWIHDVNPNVSFELGWDLYDGGIPGTIAKASGHSVHGVTQECMLGVEVKSSGSPSGGAFAGANLHYSFQGLNGWWGDITAGFLHQIDSQWTLQGSLIWNVASGYWNAKKTYVASGGTQSFMLDVRFPWKPDEHWTITPFATAVWAGNGVHQRLNNGSKIFRPFTFILGCQCGLNF